MTQKERCTCHDFGPVFRTEFESVVASGNVAAEPYDGEYSVTPTVQGQTLDTKNRYMTEDMTINPIPTYKVSNTSGGETLYIANEVK